jgi:hypothetical protein
VAAVGDEHVGKRVSGGGDVGKGLFVGMRGQGQLDHADGVAAVGHRHRQVRAVRELLHVDLLGAQHAVVHRTRQRHGLGLLGALPARVGNPEGRGTEADEGAAAEVRDQKADRARPDQGGELLGDHLDGVGRGSGFDPLEQRAKTGSRTIAIAHTVTIGWAAGPAAQAAAASPQPSSSCGGVRYCERRSPHRRHG